MAKIQCVAPVKWTDDINGKDYRPRFHDDFPGANIRVSDVTKRINHNEPNLKFMVIEIDESFTQNILAHPDYFLLKNFNPGDLVHFLKDKGVPNNARILSDVMGGNDEGRRTQLKNYFKNV